MGESSKRFLQWRKSMGATQTQAAKFLKRSLQTVFRWENSSPVLSAEDRNRIYQLGCNPDYIEVGRGDILREGVSLVDAIGAFEKAISK